MSATRDEILDAALRLPEPDRLVIASRLMETLPDNLPGLSDDDPEFAAELDRRSGDLDGSIPWEQLRDELRQSGSAGIRIRSQLSAGTSDRFESDDSPTVLSSSASGLNWCW